MPGLGDHDDLGVQRLGDPVDFHQRVWEVRVEFAHDHRSRGLTALSAFAAASWRVRVVRENAFARPGRFIASDTASRYCAKSSGLVPAYSLGRNDFQNTPTQSGTIANRVIIRMAGLVSCSRTNGPTSTKPLASSGCCAANKAGPCPLQAAPHPGGPPRPAHRAVAGGAVPFFREGEEATAARRRRLTTTT